MKQKTLKLVSLIVLLLTVCLKQTYSQGIKNTDTLSQNDKKIINIVFNVNNQMEETIKNLDTLNTLNKLIIIQKDKQLSKKDSIVDIKEKQLIQTTNQIMSLNKEVVSLKKFKTAFWYIIPVVVIETLIIILK